ncbi:phage terminase large subunit [Rhizobium sp.]
MIAADLARALDPVLLAKAAGIDPDPWQAKLLRTAPRRALLLCSRQAGKSTVAAFLVLATALYVPNALVVVVSPSQRQSSELFRTIVGYHARLPGVPELVAENTLRAEFANGSRILALPGTERTIRGYAGVDLVVIDEASRVEDELLAAVRPMLATKPKSKLIALTTPAGKRGWFYDAWIGDEKWERVRVSAYDCPRISREHLEEERRSMGPILFSQEYELEFHDDTIAVFPVALIAAAFSPEVRPLW